MTNKNEDEYFLTITAKNLIDILKEYCSDSKLFELREADGELVVVIKRCIENRYLIEGLFKNS